jgi:hypothetical protein
MVIWNPFKRMTSGSSANERRMLFIETATTPYRIEEMRKNLLF